MGTPAIIVMEHLTARNVILRTMFVKLGRLLKELILILQIQKCQIKLVLSSIGQENNFS